MRCSVSHRLIKRSGEANQDGWRLPAPELERKVVEVISAKLTSATVTIQLVPDAKVGEMSRAQDKLTKISSDKTSKQVLDLVQRIDIKPGEIKVVLDQKAIAETLSVKEDRIDTNPLTITSPFQIRKRGVETKLILGGNRVELDETLITNIAKAHHWYEQIKAGKTLSEIAKNENTTNGRISHLIGMAFLTPDIIREVLEGKQPIGFTSDWFVRHEMPSDWTAQRKLLTTL